MLLYERVNFSSNTIFTRYRPVSVAKRGDEFGDPRKSRKSYETQRAFCAICIGVDAFLTMRLMDGSRSFTGASLESLKNDPAHRRAHISAGVYRRSDAPIYRVYQKQRILTET